MIALHADPFGVWGEGWKTHGRDLAFVPRIDAFTNAS